MNDKMAKEIGKTIIEMSKDMAVVKEVTKRVEIHLKELNGSVAKNTNFRIKRTGEIRVVYGLLAAVGAPVLILVLREFATRI